MYKPVFLDNLGQILQKTPKYTIKKEMPWYNFHWRSTRKIRDEYCDMDYIDSLDTQTKQWLMKFNSEYNNASFRENTPRLHNSKELELDCYNRNNFRNRDIYALLRSRHLIVPIGLDLPDQHFCEYETELIEYIDSKKA